MRVIVRPSDVNLARPLFPSCSTVWWTPIVRELLSLPPEQRAVFKQGLRATFERWNRVEFLGRGCTSKQYLAIPGTRLDEERIADRRRRL